MINDDPPEPLENWQSNTSLWNLFRRPTLTVRGYPGKTGVAAGLNRAAAATRSPQPQPAA